ELAAAVIRDHDRIGAGVDGGARVVRVEDALEDELARPQASHPGDIAPGKSRDELTGDPLRKRRHVIADAQPSAEIAEIAARRAQHAQNPARLAQHIERIGERQARRYGQSILYVSVALSLYLQVAGQYERRALCGFGALDQRLGEAAIAH